MKSSKISKYFHLHNFCMVVQSLSQQAYFYVLNLSSLRCCPVGSFFTNQQGWLERYCMLQPELPALFMSQTQTACHKMAVLMAMFFANFKYWLLPHVPALFMSQTQWQCSWTCFCNLQISTSATRASLVHDITDTQCQKQNGSSHGCISANFKYWFFTN